MSVKSDTTTVLHTPDAIEFFALLSLRGLLTLWCNGMRSNRVNLKSLAARFNLSQYRNAHAMLAEVCTRIEAYRAENGPKIASGVSVA